ncbi:adenylyl-sulfate kinase [Aeromicrobium marinum DSM 15272]|uniref:Adenylyl-sulfate kinase n=1 Tax=Aeromicrobium marinum DSM 15272 TaxID=585531 RepID=E2SEP8_9ACTN|nr:adenylyl-sulfate kinase [Aeromicrobium marinum]EFQ82345.1 adenylyl-sulfate kinase [Aeromicrobium marinum DSM 15272]
MSQLVRIATTGSVDDGKSTLIGRLLFDGKAIFEDQLGAVEAASAARGHEGPDLALLTDGLRAEREQGITIDVAYRYFATPRRKFIIADTPGHLQYTRNMVTGASTADVALILIDARRGVLEQSRRHAFLASLLGIPHLVVCVNKMDLVDYAQDRFDDIRTEFASFASKLEIPDLTFIPVSALTGDNVVTKSAAMPWYEGPALLGHLEDLHVASDRNLIDARLPVQYVIRPQGADFHDFRGYAGTVAGGSFRPGDEVVALPSGFTSTVTHVWGPGGTKLEEASTGQAVTVELADQLDVSRGDMLCRPNNRPTSTQDVEAMVCWMDGDLSLSPDSTYTILHTTRETRASVKDLEYRLDINTLHRDQEATALGLNEIGRVRLRTQKPLHLDAYRRNRDTGSFILIDEATHRTVAAGMILGASQNTANIVWHSGSVTREQRATRGMTLWFTGLSGSGKSTVAVEVERRLVASGQPAYVLDGDNLRHGLNSGLGFSPADRAENVRRVAEVARLMADAGVVAIVSLVSPYRADRDAARALHDADGLSFLEVFMDTPLEIAEARDPKGLYAKARTGEIPEFTGISAPYEAPLRPELLLRPTDGDAGALAEIVIDHLERR